MLNFFESKAKQNSKVVAAAPTEQVHSDLTSATPAPVITKEEATIAKNNQAAEEAACQWPASNESGTMGSVLTLMPCVQKCFGTATAENIPPADGVTATPIQLGEAARASLGSIFHQM
jgi:hypothetical protein